ncbi:hypothetical protein [Sphingomonas aracearum]|uniref:hypothetical protein n=1 Tax=Sphingomonas aracearum TaxID=2283317 RepID=UPI0011C039B9|nr:hypothetical protein [Sphingomonas aracearum]
MNAKIAVGVGTRSKRQLPAATSDPKRSSPGTIGPVVALARDVEYARAACRRLFLGRARHDDATIAPWRRLDPEPTIPEIMRNNPIRPVAAVDLTRSGRRT